MSRAALALGVLLGALVLGTRAESRQTSDPDELYRRRDDLTSAMRAADIWAQRSRIDAEAAWKLSRVSYWLGTHQADGSRRAALERGVGAGEDAVRLAGDRPEGHFWLGANMGELAQSGGPLTALRYRGRIKREFERVVDIDAAWQGGSADAALGQWYASVPRLFGGSPEEAERHFRLALAHDPNNTAALSYFAELLMASGRTGEARAYLRRVADVPFDPEWAPEDREFKREAAVLLGRLGS
ncbi:MAG: TRAP transporter TatT component family protein [Acidobacteriota bacterium]